MDLWEFCATEAGDNNEYQAKEEILFPGSESVFGL